MRNFVHITGVADDRKNGLHSFHSGFRGTANNPYNHKAESTQVETPAPLIIKWQYTDYKLERSRKEEENNLYVADWQMISF